METLEFPIYLETASSEKGRWLTEYELFESGYGVFHCGTASWVGIRHVVQQLSQEVEVAVPVAPCYGATLSSLSVQMVEVKKIREPDRNGYPL